MPFRHASPPRQLAPLYLLSIPPHHLRISATVHFIAKWRGKFPGFPGIEGYDQEQKIHFDGVTVSASNPKISYHTGVHHVGLYASNPAVSAEFYRDVFGMEIVGGSTADHPLGTSAFLSSRPTEESHEVALFANPALAHVAFKVASLAELRAFHARIVEKNIPIKMSFNHRASFAFYFEDPDGNLIEVYWATGDLSLAQPQVDLLDLLQADEVLLAGIVTTAGN
jgi:catechol 2,3-dioxygenase-like lactoylglutathione lyase family enzyme